jgi:beta-N-acetylhexosaminidase
MAFSLEQALGQKLLLGFAGKDRLPPELEVALSDYQPTGISLFRALNIENPAQVRRLTHALQQAAQQAGLPELLIAVDQEGGQLVAIGEGTTQLPGNLALGATGSPDLARQAGLVLGRELAAMGVNVNFAPCCDVNTNPQNPVIGTRSFGEHPQAVAKLASALIQGLQSCGVAATAKHFPGHGDTTSDSHHGVPVVLHGLERLQEVEFLPFAAAIHSEVKLIMSGHLALPAIDGDTGIPATLSKTILNGVLRKNLGFEGVVVTDALDMQAIHQGEELGEQAARAASAGADLLLITANPLDHRRIFSGLQRSVQSGQLEQAEIQASARRVQALKRWLAEQSAPPDLSIVGCHAHRAIADEIARRSITLVRDQASLLPLRLQPGQRLAVILPRPLDLTPADTSSYVVPNLAQALRRYHPEIDEYSIPHAPGSADIAAVLDQVRRHRLVIVATLNAYSQPAQAVLVHALLQTGIPTIVVALRMPYDLSAFPQAPVYVCTYSMLEPSLNALADALWGFSKFTGALPISIPGLYPIGHFHQAE